MASIPICVSASGNIANQLLYELTPGHGFDTVPGVSVSHQEESHDNAGQSPRLLLKANEVTTVYCKPGDKVAWVAA